MFLEANTPKVPQSWQPGLAARIRHRTYGQEHLVPGLAVVRARLGIHPDGLRGRGVQRTILIIRQVIVLFELVLLVVRRRGLQEDGSSQVDPFYERVHVRKAVAGVALTAILQKSDDARG